MVCGHKTTMIDDDELGKTYIDLASAVNNLLLDVSRL